MADQDIEIAIRTVRRAAEEDFATLAGELEGQEAYAVETFLDCGYVEGQEARAACTCWENSESKEKRNVNEAYKLTVAITGQNPTVEYFAKPEDRADRMVQVMFGISARLADQTTHSEEYDPLVNFGGYAIMIVDTDGSETPNQHWGEKEKRGAPDAIIEWTRP